MFPIKTKETNFSYLGPTVDVSDLPCRRMGRDTFSVWVLTEEERQQIAAGGNIRLGIYGIVPIPPVSLEVCLNQGPFERVPCYCAICGREVDDGAHDGTGHAFKEAHG